MKSTQEYKLELSETGLWNLVGSSGCSHKVHLVEESNARSWLNSQDERRNREDPEEKVTPVTEIELARIILRYNVTQEEILSCRERHNSIARHE